MKQNVGNETSTIIWFNRTICQFLAQQEAQRAQFVVEKAKQERQQKIVQAEGEAQAATLISFYSSLA